MLLTRADAYSEVGLSESADVCGRIGQTGSRRCRDVERLMNRGSYA